MLELLLRWTRRGDRAYVDLLLITVNAPTVNYHMKHRLHIIKAGEVLIYYSLTLFSFDCLDVEPSVTSGGL